MGCLKLDEIQFKRTDDKMGTWNKKREEKIPVKEDGFSEHQLMQLKAMFEESDFKNPHLEKIQIIVTIVVGIITIITTVSALLFTLWSTGKRIGDLEESVSRLDKLSSEMDEYLYDDDGVKDQLGMINEALNLKVINVTDDDTVSFIEDISIENNNISNTTSAFNAKMPVGIDLNGNVYIAEDLIGQTILLTYKDEGKDVFFLGQYNENYHWNGYCVTNTYNSDGTLYGICESNFDNGERLDYKTMLCVDKANNEWDYYHRSCDGEVNTGISIEYIIKYDKVKNFTNTNVRIIDMLYVDKFVSEQEKVVTRYYNGNTSNGTYNDDTGKAYLVSFYEDGTVRTLYVGKFVDGYPNDKSGEAWNIAYAEKVGYYVHNTGTFTNGYADKHSSKEFTHKEIEMLISKYTFDCELKWK